jgi:hypothetical protein
MSSQSETIYTRESIFYEVYRKVAALGKKRNVGVTVTILVAFFFKIVTFISKPAMGSTLSLTYWVPRNLSLGMKRKGREAVHSPSASAEVNKSRIYISIFHKSAFN